MADYKEKIKAAGVEIAVVSKGNDDDYISLTDIARFRSDEPKDVIKNWLRSRSTIEFLGLWELLNNPNFNDAEFEMIKSESGANAFTMSPQKWVSTTNSIGIRSAAGRSGGTFAHKDIAFEFASWVSPEFKLYIIKDYQRLKQDENSRLSLNWNIKRALSKVNYRIHTDAIKHHLIPEDLSKLEISYTYAGEADVLNLAIFGMTAKEWRDKNPDRPKKENIRDSATVEQLVVLTNLESINAEMIKQNTPKQDRIIELNKIARSQLKTLSGSSSMKKLTDLHNQTQARKVIPSPKPDEPKP